MGEAMVTRIEDDLVSQGADGESLIDAARDMKDVVKRIDRLVGRNMKEKNIAKVKLEIDELRKNLDHLIELAASQPTQGKYFAAALPGAEMEHIDMRNNADKD